MKNTYIDANPAVIYYVDKQRFGGPGQPAEQTSHDASRKTQKEQQDEMQHTMYLIGPTLEQKFRQYLAAFDGKKKDFSEVEHLFDALFHKEFCDTINFRQQAVSREQMKALHAKYFAMGTKATLVHYRRVGFSTIDVSYNLFNDQEEVVTRQLITRQNGRIVRAQRISYLRVALNVNDVCEGKRFLGLLKLRAQVHHTWRHDGIATPTGRWQGL